VEREIYDELERGRPPERPRRAVHDHRAEDRDVDIL
jgi:hypothetical protein